jgi:uncharacterized membrane protein YagU involved in acid resistance
MTHSSSDRGAILKAILLAGITVGILDFIFAMVLFKGTAIEIAQSISQGFFGREAAFAGGTYTATIGVLCHFIVAFGAATIFVLASRKLPTLIEHAIGMGMLFGVGVHLFMQFVVIPLSKVPHRPINWKYFLISAVGHAILIGLPIALINRHFATKRVGATAA